LDDGMVFWLEVKNLRFGKSAFAFLVWT
jgi:hypothetical protein